VRVFFFNVNVTKGFVNSGAFCYASDLRYRDRSGSKQDGGKDVKVKVSYSPLREALKQRWSGVPRRQTKNLNPGAVFMILGRDSTRFHLATGCLRLGGRNSIVGASKPSAGTAPG
jgi:hypothetical protein